MPMPSRRRARFAGVVFLRLAVGRGGASAGGWHDAPDWRAEHRATKAVGSLSEYNAKLREGSSGSSHLDAPLVPADARPVSLGGGGVVLPDGFPQLREYASWAEWFESRDAANPPKPTDPPPAQKKDAKPAAAAAPAAAPLLVVPLVDNASLPLFVIAGVQKGGTTFLRMLLSQHPMLSAGRDLKGR